MKKILSIALLATLLVGIVAVAIPANAQLPLPSGVPRGDVLVVENHYGTHADPKNFNYLVPGRPGFGASGFSQVCAGFLWYINTTNSELINWLAAAPPEDSSDFKTMKVYLRKGIMWSDGTPFTADDVVFHVKMIMGTEGMNGHYLFKNWVEDVYKENDYTVVFKLKKPNPRFHYFLTVIIYGAPYQAIMPKHVWEKVKDPLKFKFYPPVCLGPYVLKDVDPGGNWFLWERNEGWWGTKLYGMKPAPKYVLFIHHGPEEKKALAMSKHELDAIRTFLPENFEIVWKNNKYIGGWRGKPPFAWPFDACVKGVAFNVLKYPYSIPEVRKALAHAINFKAVFEAFTGPDGSKPTPSVLPIVRYIFVDKPYYVALKDELLKLGLDPSPPKDIQEHLKSMGLDPSIVWWKFDPEYSKELLKKAGFTYKDGHWYTPKGEKWVIHITAPSGFEMESQRIAFLVAEQWKKNLGVDVVVEPVESGTFSTRWSRGKFEVGAFWPGCSLLADLTPHIQWWASKYFDPNAPSVGWAGYKFPKRAELDKIIDELERTPPWDPKVKELARRALIIWAEQLPWAGFFPTPFYTLHDKYCWENWPEYPDNYYLDPVYWWAQMLFIILQLKPTGRCPTKEAVQPGNPPVLPVEKPTATTPKTAPKTAAPGPTVTVTKTVERTAVATIEKVKTLFTTVTREVTSVVTDWTTAGVLGVVLLIVGIAIGYVMRRR